MLRPAFFKNAGKGKVRDQVQVITICFGGADSKNFATKYLEALNHIDRSFQVNIILGASNHNPNSEYEKFNKKLLLIDHQVMSTSGGQFSLNSKLVDAEYNITYRLPM